MPTVWKIADGLPRAVECEVAGWPHEDADGDTMMDNTHFATEAEAWEYAERDAYLRLKFAARDVENVRSALAKAEREAADAGIAYMEVREARERAAEAQP